MVAGHKPLNPHPVARDSRLWPRQGSPAVPTHGPGPGATGCPSSEQGATLVAHIHIVKMVKRAHPCTAVDARMTWDERVERDRLP